MSTFRYKAFISYSWADAAWGKWLHRAIETYRTPTALVGKETPNGPVPARLMPLFKDREEEAAGTSIGAAVEAALNASEFLIVVCSPRSAQSQWVNREIAWFKTHRDPAKVLALIVDGEPGSVDAECFPRALTHRVAPDLAITDEHLDAPLAADARPSGDGKRGARLKLAAAMLGVGLDELVRRDRRRRALRTRWITGGALALAAAMTVLAVTAVRARDEARHQRAEADGLVEFMLTDLRKKLEPVGRLDALDVVGQRALKYYAGQKPGDLDADALGRRSRALHLVGEVRDLRGDSEGALAGFRQAAATTAELLARDPGNAQRIFDHAQSAYWVGFIAYQRGQEQEAEARFREYRRLADRLVQLDSGNPDWQMEVSHAESNLGTLLFDQGRYSEAEQVFTKALHVCEMLARQSPDKIHRQIEVARSMSWLANTIDRQERIGPALAVYHRELAIYGQILAKDPANTTAQTGTATAWAKIGEQEAARGAGPAALAALRTAVGINEKLRAGEPANSLWTEGEVKNRYRYSFAAWLFDDRAESWRQLGMAQELLKGLVASDHSIEGWNVDLSARLAALEARLRSGNRDFKGALESAQRSVALLQKRKDQDDPTIRADLGWAQLLVGDIQAKLGHPADARISWKSAARSVSGEDDDLPSSLLSVHYGACKRLDDTNCASRLRTKLDERSYRHPLYQRELRRVS